MASQQGIARELQSRGFTPYFWHHNSSGPGWKTAEHGSFREFSSIDHGDGIDHLTMSYQKDGRVVVMGLEEAGFPPSICMSSAPFVRSWTETKDGKTWHHTLCPADIRKGLGVYSDEEIVNAIEAGVKLPLSRP